MFERLGFFLDSAFLLDLALEGDDVLGPCLGLSPKCEIWTPKLEQKEDFQQQLWRRADKQNIGTIHLFFTLSKKFEIRISLEIEQANLKICKTMRRKNL